MEMEQEKMRLKLISCEVFAREVCLVAASSRQVVDIEFTPKGAHEQSDFLRNLIQEKIDQTELSERDYDGILLGFGLCGNSTRGLKARSLPLIIPRAHDCCTIFLGSKDKFVEHFGNRLSAEWTSVGYLERGESYIRELDLEDSLGNNRSYQDLVEQYGEENADYIWETLHPDLTDSIIYIEIPEFADLGYAEQIKKEAETDDKKFEMIQGDIRLISMLINGSWNRDEFLIVPPGETIKAVYDHDQIITT